MKEIALTDFQRVKVIDSGAPQIAKPNEVLIKVKKVTLCGSDISYFNRKTLPYDLQYPIVLGHEVSGEIIDVGKHVDSLKKGDRVSVEPQYYCGECDYCKKGLYQFCVHSKFLASRGYPGALKEYLVWDYKSVHKLPDSLSYESGALLEPMSVAYSGIKKLCLENSSNRKVLILGGGAIGLLVAMLLNSLFPKVEYLIVDQYEERIKQASALGISKEKFNSLLRGEKVTDIIDTTGNSKLIMSYMSRLDYTGNLVMIGLSDSQIVFQVRNFIYNGWSIKTVYRYTNTWPFLINLLENGGLVPDKIITQTYSISDAQSAFEISNDKRKSIKVCINF